MHGNRGIGGPLEIKRVSKSERVHIRNAAYTDFLVSPGDGDGRGLKDQKKRNQCSGGNHLVKECGL